MSFAARFPGFRPAKGWTYVGSAAATSGASISFPSAAQAGDLAVVVYVHSAGNRVLPSGYSWLYEGSTIPRHCYKLCAGGETSVAKPNDSTGIGSMMLFRPRGGGAYLSSSQFSEPPASVTVEAPGSPSLIIGACATAAPATFTKTVASGYVTNTEYTSNPSLHQGYHIVTVGASGAYRIAASAGTPRQVMACFGIS